MSQHKHDKHCGHKPPVDPPPVDPPPVVPPPVVLPPVIEIQPPAPPVNVHQVPIEGAAPMLIPVLLIAAWAAFKRRNY